jgi:hypothetical protein
LLIHLPRCESSLMPFDGWFGNRCSISDYDTFVPDVAVVKPRTIPIFRIFQGAPELAIEVVSPSDTAKHLERKVGVSICKAEQNRSGSFFLKLRSVMVYTRAIRSAN